MIITNKLAYEVFRYAYKNNIFDDEDMQSELSKTFIQMRKHMECCNFDFSNLMLEFNIYDKTQSKPILHKYYCNKCGEVISYDDYETNKFIEEYSKSELCFCEQCYYEELERQREFHEETQGRW